MQNLLLNLPGGAEWIILALGLLLPAVGMYATYILAKKMMKDSVKEAIRELKSEGVL